MESKKQVVMLARSTEQPKDEIEKREPAAAAEIETTNSKHRLLLADEAKLHDVKQPHSNDVLSGRGVTTNR